ncbi:MAG: hypothetical protein ABIP13_02905 [Tepidiformaceae bacterium]
MKRRFLPSAVMIAALSALGAVAVFAASSDTLLQGGDDLRIRCTGTKLTTTRVSTNEVLAKCVAAPTSTPTRTPLPATATASPTRTATPASTATPAATPTATPVSGGFSPMLGGCPVFPANNAWNTAVSSYPVDSNSASYLSGIAGLGGNQALHADFGSNLTYGIPFVIVTSSQPTVPITFTAYGDESDPGPYPVPLNAPVEGGSSSTGDRHVLVLQQGACKLYEMYRAFQSGSGWNADSGAVFDLNSNALRPEGWTSADAAGLPILPGLARYDEVKSGQINHALRFTVAQTQRAYIHPAVHWASSSTATNLPPMGLRLRLKASYDISSFTGDSRVILQAMKTYGMIVADNGSNWFVSGATDSRWNDTDLDQMKTVPGSAFEVVTTGAIVR